MPARVGVVIATRNRAEQLCATLHRLRALPERPPIVVVDNDSWDETPAVVREQRGVRLVRLRHNAGAAGRTVGVHLLETPAVAFADDDSWWGAGSLARAADLFETHPELGLIAARILVEPAGREDPTCRQMRAGPLARAWSPPGPPVLGFLACGAIVRRAAYLGVGGFHPRYGIGGEERLLALDLASAGWRQAYVADILAHHQPSTASRAGRTTALARNELWSAWLRRPAGRALAATVRTVARALRSHDERRAAAQALRGMPWVVRERRRLPRAIEHDVRLLERAHRPR